MVTSNKQVESERAKVIDVVADRLLQAAKASPEPKECLCCGELTTGAISKSGDRWPRVCPPCKEKHDAMDDAVASVFARASGGVRPTDGVEATMAVEASMPTTWTGNELGEVLPRPARTYPSVSVIMDFDGLLVDVEVEYEWEHNTRKDGEYAEGRRAVARRVFMVPENKATQKITDQIDLHDDAIVEAMRELSDD